MERIVAARVQLESGFVEEEGKGRGKKKRTSFFALRATPDLPPRERLPVLVCPLPDKLASRTPNRLHAPMQLYEIPLRLRLPLPLFLRRRERRGRRAGRKTREREGAQPRVDPLPPVDVLRVNAQELRALLKGAEEGVGLGEGLWCRR